MANKKDGVQFTQESAERISRVVRAVEQSIRDETDPRGRRPEVVPVMVRIVELAADHDPGDVDTDAILARWDPTDPATTKGGYDGDDAMEVTVDDFMRVGLGRKGFGSPGPMRGSLVTVAKLPGDVNWNLIDGQLYRWAFGIVYSSITAASGTTPGSGEVDIYYLDTTGHFGNQGLLYSPGRRVTAYNWLKFSGAIAAGKHVKLDYQPFEDRWWVASEEW